MSPLSRNTIYGIMTPAGRAALAALRLSGPDCQRILEQLSLRKAPPIGRLKRRELFDPQTGDLLDEAMVVLFKAPNSYTGEDVAEIHLHGSPVLLQHLVGLMPSLGAQAAEPGEFTLRAFLNGRKDLAQAEAVHDLVDARSIAAVRLAARGVSGDLSDRVSQLQATLLSLLAQLEAEIDFPEDVPSTPLASLRRDLEATIQQTSSLLAGYQRARLLKEGFRVVLVGPPNAGKSSLFNALLGRERSIVTQEAGTTRDYLEEFLPHAPLPIVLVDTAGLRAVEGKAEAMGVERSLQQAEQADLILRLRNPFAVEDTSGLGRAKAHTGARLVLTHADLMPNHKPVSGPEPWAVVSSKSGVGLDTLRTKMIEAAHAAALGPDGGLPLVANARQAEALSLAQQALQEALSESAVLPTDILASLVRKALQHLGHMTGERISEQILHQIFSKFCIGK